MSRIVGFVALGLLVLGCGGNVGGEAEVGRIFSGEILANGTPTKVVVNLANRSSDSGILRLYSDSMPVSGRVAVNVQGEVISLRGTLSEPYGATSFDGLLRGNELNGTLDSAAFDAVPFSAIAETPPNPYSGWVKLQLKGPGSVDEVVPGFWVVAENQPYVNLDAAYIADPNDQNISDAYGRAIYTGGGSWFATMTWSNNVSGYLFRVLLLPGSTEAQVEVIQNNQIVIGGQGSYTLISYTP